MSIFELRFYSNLQIVTALHCCFFVKILLTAVVLKKKQLNWLILVISETKYIDVVEVEVFKYR
jgi:hypothetical protein